MLVNNTVCLCGYFSAKNPVSPEMLQGWTKKTYSDADVEELSNYYFPEFAAFMTGDMPRYDLVVDKPCMLRFSSGAMTR